jgi:hypothetical protein
MGVIAALTIPKTENLTSDLGEAAHASSNPFFRLALTRNARLAVSDFILLKLKIRPEWRRLYLPPNDYSHIL